MGHTKVRYCNSKIPTPNAFSSDVNVSERGAHSRYARRNDICGPRESEERKNDVVWTNTSGAVSI